MKYKCNICGQIVEDAEICPVCNSTINAFTLIEEDSVSSTNNTDRYRCLLCGATSDVLRVCEECGSVSIFDNEEDRVVNFKEFFEEEVSKVEEEIINDNSLNEEITNDEYLEEESVNEESKEEVEEEFDEEVIIVDEPEEREEYECKVHQEEFDNTLFDEDEISESFEKLKENYGSKSNDSYTSSDENIITLKARRADLIFLKLKYLFCLLQEASITDSVPLDLINDLIKDEIRNISIEKTSQFEWRDIIQVISDSIKVNEAIFELEKTPENGYLLTKDQKLKSLFIFSSKEEDE